MKPLISVIIPIYNSEKYFDRCLNSILNQTYQNIEILLINDGSIDNSAKLCDMVAMKDKRIKVVHQTNKGVSSARNRGLDIANGEYITFIDSDDWIDRDAIEYLYENLINNNSDLSIYSFNKEYDNKKSYSNDFTENIINMNKKQGIKFVFNDDRCQGFVWNKLYKSKIINYKENKIRFNEDITVLEDLYFNIQYIDKCNKVTYINSAKYHYYISGDSAMFSPFNKKKMSSLLALENILNILTKLDSELVNIAKGHYIVTNLLLLTNIYDSNYNDIKLEKELYRNIKNNKKYFISYRNCNLKQKLGFYILCINKNLFKALVKILHKKSFIS